MQRLHAGADVRDVATVGRRASLTFWIDPDSPDGESWQGRGPHGKPELHRI